MKKDNEKKKKDFGLWMKGDWQCWAVLWILKNLLFRFFKYCGIRERTTGSVFLGENIQKQRTASSGYFKTLERIDHFHERTGKEPVVLSGWFFDFFHVLRTMIYVPIPRLFELSWEPAGKWVYTRDDNQRVYFSHSKNHPNFGYLPCALHGMSQPKDVQLLLERKLWSLFNLYTMVFVGCVPRVWMQNILAFGWSNKFGQFLALVTLLRLHLLSKCDEYHKLLAIHLNWSSIE